MWNFIAWIILGALAGWIASILMGTNARQGLGMNIIVGIAGAAIGGFLMSIFNQGGATGLNFWSLIVAVIGSVVLLWIVRMIRK